MSDRDRSDVVKSRGITKCHLPPKWPMDLRFEQLIFFGPRTFGLTDWLTVQLVQMKILDFGRFGTHAFVPLVLYRLRWGHPAECSGIYWSLATGPNRMSCSRITMYAYCLCGWIRITSRSKNFYIWISSTFNHFFCLSAARYNLPVVRWGILIVSPISGLMGTVCHARCTKLIGHGVQIVSTRNPKITQPRLVVFFALLRPTR